MKATKRYYNTYVCIYAQLYVHAWAGITLGGYDIHRIAYIIHLPLHVPTQ